MHVSIETPRLSLHDLSINDSMAMFEYRKNENVKLYQSFHPENIEEVKNFILSNSSDFDIENRWFQIGIYLEGVLIGDMGIHFIGPDNRQCEIGYTISVEYQKKGYGKEAVGHLLDFLFNHMRKHRVIASLNPENIASIALLESLGFRKEGIFKKSIYNTDHWEDDLIYAILDDEWKNGTGACLEHAFGAR